MKLAIIDNYDSFTWNLIEMIRERFQGEWSIFPNDQVSSRTLQAYDKILISPGPGLPSEAGQLREILYELGPVHDILGICLGHQAIAEVYGARLIRTEVVFHGLCSQVSILPPADILFRGVRSPFMAGRYHSWFIDPSSLSSHLEITAVSGEGIPMAIRHKRFEVRGLQFHPESYMTTEGSKMIENWLRYHP